MSVVFVVNKPQDCIAIFLEIEVGFQIMQLNFNDMLLTKEKQVNKLDYSRLQNMAKTKSCKIASAHHPTYCRKIEADIFIKNLSCIDD
jgi:hypothetical protein